MASLIYNFVGHLTISNQPGVLPDRSTKCFLTSLLHTGQFSQVFRSYTTRNYKRVNVLQLVTQESKYGQAIAQSLFSKEAKLLAFELHEKENSKRVG
jgi:hypothetical protein